MGASIARARGRVKAENCGGRASVTEFRSRARASRRMQGKSVPDLERPPAHGAVQPLTARKSGPLAGRARMPGDKSISHRALLLSLLAVGSSEIDGLLEGDDVL